ALQPALVKGRWTRDEDKIITDSVAARNMKWSCQARRLDGRQDEDPVRGKEGAREQVGRDRQAHPGTVRELGQESLVQPEDGESKYVTLALQCIRFRASRVCSLHRSDRPAVQPQGSEEEFRGGLGAADHASADAAVSSKEEEHDIGPMMHIPPHLDDLDRGRRPSRLVRARVGRGVRPLGG
ncbi:hypothetical protein ACHAWF_001915, partial [Thalassiosira exigua]